MATSSDSRFKGFKFTSSKPPPLPPKDPVYLQRNANRSFASLLSPDAASPPSPRSPNTQYATIRRANSPAPSPSIEGSNHGSDTTSLSPRQNSTRRDKLAFLKFPRKSPRSPPAATAQEEEIPSTPQEDEGISLPWGFSHNIHVDEGYLGLPPSWSTSLPQLGFSQDEIAAIQTRRAAGGRSPPDLRYLYSERPNSPSSLSNGAFPQSVFSPPGAPVLTQPMPRSTSLPKPELNHPGRQDAPPVASSSSLGTMRSGASAAPPMPRRKPPPLPEDDNHSRSSKKGHKPHQASDSTMMSFTTDSHPHSSNHNHTSNSFAGMNNSMAYNYNHGYTPVTPHNQQFKNGNQSSSNLSFRTTTDDQRDAQTPLALAPLRLGSESSVMGGNTNGENKFVVMNGAKQDDSQDEESQSQDSRKEKSSIWGARVSKTKSKDSSSSSSHPPPLPLQLERQEKPQDLVSSFSISPPPPQHSFASLGTSLSNSLANASTTLASASTSLAVKGSKAVTAVKQRVRGKNGGSLSKTEEGDSYKGPEESQGGEDVISISHRDAPAQQSGRPAVWEIYTQPRPGTSPSGSRLGDGEERKPGELNRSASQGRLHAQYAAAGWVHPGSSSLSSASAGPSSSTTTPARTTRSRSNSKASQNSIASTSSASHQPANKSLSSLKSKSQTSLHSLARLGHKPSSSMSSLESIPEASPAVASTSQPHLPHPPHMLPSSFASGSTATSNNTNGMRKTPAMPPRLSLHQANGSNDLSSWSEALLSGISLSGDNGLGLDSFGLGGDRGKGKEKENVWQRQREGEPSSTVETARPGLFGSYQPQLLQHPTPQSNAITASNWSGSTSTSSTAPAPRTPTRKPGQPIPTRSPAPTRPIPPVAVGGSSVKIHPFGGGVSGTMANTNATDAPKSQTRSRSNSRSGRGDVPLPVRMVPPPLPLPLPPARPPLPVTPAQASSKPNGSIGIKALPSTKADGLLSPPPTTRTTGSGGIVSPGSSNGPDSAQLWNEIELMMDPGVMSGIPGIGMSLLPLPLGGVLRSGVGFSGQNGSSTLVSPLGVGPMTVGDMVGPSPTFNSAFVEASPTLPFTPEEERAAEARRLRGANAATQPWQQGSAVGQEDEGDTYVGREGQESDESDDEDEEADMYGDMVHHELRVGRRVRHSQAHLHAASASRGDINLDRATNRDSSRSSTSTITGLGPTTIVRNVSIARRVGAYVIDRRDVSAERRERVAGLSLPLGTQETATPSSSAPPANSLPVPNEPKHPPSPLSSHFGSGESDSSSSLEQPTPTDGGIPSPLTYYLNGIQTPSPTPDSIAFNHLPQPPSDDFPGKANTRDFSPSPYGVEEEDNDLLNAGGVPRPTIVINDAPPSAEALPTSMTTPGTTPLSPFQRYRGWQSKVVAPLEEFIDEAVDPRDHYLNLQEIAEGDSGSVFSACLNPETAHKLRLPPLTKARDSDDIVHGQVTLVAIKSVAIVPSGSPKLVDLQRELSLMRGLGHENVLGMDGVYVDLQEDSLWVRMELMERSLADVVGLVSEGLMLQDRMIARFASDVLCALEYLQNHHISHRDVRSDNLLLNKHGVLKLTDFSNAVQVTKENPMRSDAAGVVFWQAPEVRKPPYDALKVDVWSLGATVWEMAETEPPFSDTKQLADRWPPLRQPELYSPAFHEFLRKCSEPAASRPSPSALMKSSFVNNACGRPVIVQLLSQCMAIEQVLQEPGS